MNRDFEAVFCKLNQYYGANCLQPVKHFSANVCNTDCDGHFSLEYLKYSVNY